MNVEGLAPMLGCMVGSLSTLSTKYLGFPLGAPHKSTKWDLVEEEFQRELTFVK